MDCGISAMAIREVALRLTERRGIGTAQDRSYMLKNLVRSKSLDTHTSKNREGIGREDIELVRNQLMRYRVES